MARDISGFLHMKKATASDSDIAEEWDEIEKLYERKLWHQLTTKLVGFVKHESFSSGGLLELYHGFIADFETKIKPLSLVDIILAVSKEITDKEEAIKFIQKTEEKVASNQEAKLMCQTAVTVMQLELSQLPEVKAGIETIGEALDAIDGITPVHAVYYDVSSKYYKKCADHAAYYRDALRYLGCMELDDIPAGEQLERAFHLSLAALLGEGVYNFGELLAHDILDSLKGTEKQWVVELLFAFNTGDLEKFESLRPKWSQQPDLVDNYNKLSRKIRLLCFMELIFNRHAHDRTISFSTIATAAQVPLPEVEHLVMKALSLGLVRGSIDQVSQEVTMTWVQPRVLDISQVSSLHNRMEVWCKDIISTVHLVKDEMPELVSQLSS
ncbi:26S proteasome non-ATPase regulatory subunit 13-like [Dysidea avara]|uniref:26S proteasome non-ATPase regulatory subunit 13-like n=1 Tax=Dysidea avara TaxID=196820 RepID=UPI0033194569